MKTTLPLALRLALASLLAGACFQPAAVQAGTVLEAGGTTVWKFLDDGTEPDAAWRQPRFDDSKWMAGRAPLGYGETRLELLVRIPPDPAHKHISTWFRGSFVAPELRSTEHLVLLICVDDGAVIYLNGEELGRVNMPTGRVGARYTRGASNRPFRRGLVHSATVPSTAVRPKQENVLAVEVHQAAATSSDLFLDLALKVCEAPTRLHPDVPVAAQEVTNTYHQRHYVGPGLKIPDGYLDGGRHMVIDATHRATSERELIRVDRSRDVELAGRPRFCPSRELRDLPVLERIQRIAARIDREATPPGGRA